MINKLTDKVILNSVFGFFLIAFFRHQALHSHLEHHGFTHRAIIILFVEGRNTFSLYSLLTF